MRKKSPRPEVGIVGSRLGRGMLGRPGKGSRAEVNIYHAVAKLVARNGRSAG